MDTLYNKLKKTLEEFLKDKQLQIEPSSPNTTPLFLLLTVKPNLVGFATLDGQPKENFSKAFQNFKDLYSIHSSAWADFDLTLVLCKTDTEKIHDEFCNEVEADPYFCRKFVIDLSKDLKVELGRLPFIPLLPETIVGLKRPISAQTFLMKHGVSSDLAKYLVVPHARGIEGIVNECIEGVLGKPEWRKAEIGELRLPQYRGGPNLRLKEIEINNFRAYRESFKFDLDADLIVLFGPNGFGKTSFFDAIDFISTGGVARFDERFVRKTDRLLKALKHLDSSLDNSFVKVKTLTLDIYLCFIIKRNLDPDYSLFLQKTIQYLNENMYIAIRRSDGAVLFVNNAGKNGPGYCENFGKSGFVFHPNCSFVSHKKYCPPTYSLKAREGLATCKEARFRESGACIISFKFLPPIPAIVRRIPATRMIPMNPAIIHSIDAPIGGIEEDPRTPGSEVPASVKWVNDCLDTIDFVLRNKGSHPLRNEIKDSHNMVCKEIRRKSDEFLRRYIAIASCEIENEKDKWIESESRKIHNVDNWDENEQKALETVVYSLSIMKVCMPLEVSSSPVHATIKIQDKVIDVIVVSGKNHDACYEYAKNKYPGSGEKFVIVVTHDGRSSLSEKHIDSIYDIKYDSSRGPHIADPSSRFYHCGYQNLIDGCFHSQSLEELDGKASEIMWV
jgi:ATPase involved in DNA repair